MSICDGDLLAGNTFGSNTISIVSSLDDVNNLGVPGAEAVFCGRLGG